MFLLTFQNNGIFLISSSRFFNKGNFLTAPFRSISNISREIASSISSISVCMISAFVNRCWCSSSAAGSVGSAVTWVSDFDFFAGGEGEGEEAFCFFDDMMREKELCLVTGWRYDSIRWVAVPVPVDTTVVLFVDGHRRV